MSAVNVCQVCNKLFSTKYILSEHVRAKHATPSDAKDEKRALKCTSCDYMTAKPSDIEKHIAKCKFVWFQTQSEKLYLQLVEKDAYIAKLEKRLNVEEDKSEDKPEAEDKPMEVEEPVEV